MNSIKLRLRTVIKSANWQWALEAFVQLLAPFAPHISEELWHQLGKEDSVHLSSWPVYDEKYLVLDQLTIVVQINGKVQSTISVSVEASEDQVIDQAKKDEKVANYLENQEIKKTIYVPGKLVSFVI
jgi:leucyl-tRNA synthetase